jgi:hypothetical protein
MSLREAELLRSHRAQRSHTKQIERKKQRKKRSVPPPLALQSMLLDEQVLTFGEWCQVNRFSERQGRRILRGGSGPVVTHLSERRIGIRVGDNRRWQESRARG